MEQERKPLATIVIQCYGPNDIAVAAPQQDLGLCYMMLELAKDAIRAASGNETQLVVPNIPAAGAGSH